METKKHFSLTIQTIYELLTGLQLIFIPNILLATFGFEPTNEIWIKVMGVLVLSAAIFYYTLSKNPYTEIVRASVFMRVLIASGFVLLVVTGQVKATLILFAGIDAATAIWTWTELKKVEK
jgi:hypothetical protein